MARSLANEKDVKETTEAMQKTDKTIKIGNKCYIRFNSLEYEREFVHFDEKNGVSFVCLAPFKDKGYNPEKCPKCKEISKKWDDYNEAKNQKKDSLKNKIYNEINKLKAKLQTVMVATKGNIVTDEDEDGELKTRVEWEKQCKGIRISPAQWTKLTSTIFEDYDFMKSTKDLVNRNFLFKKESRSGKEKGQDYTEVEIKPSKKKSEPPEIENEIPDFKEFFNYLSKKEIENLVNGNSEKVIDEDLELDEDIEELKEEKTQKKKSTKKTEKKETKKTKSTKKKKEEPKEEDEEPDFVKDDFDDEIDDISDDLEDDTDEDEEDFDDFDDFDDDTDEDDEDYDDFDDEDE